MLQAAFEKSFFAVGELLNTVRIERERGKLIETPLEVPDEEATSNSTLLQPRVSHATMLSTPRTSLPAGPRKMRVNGGWMDSVSRVSTLSQNHRAYDLRESSLVREARVC